MAYIGLLWLLATCASAAHVQTQTCQANLTDENGFRTSMGLSAKLEHLNGPYDRISLTIFRFVEEEECATWNNDTATASVSVDMLGRSSFHTPEISATCRKRTVGTRPHQAYITLVDDIQTFPQFSTFHTTIHLNGSLLEAGCLQAHITPELSSTVRSTLRYAPLGIFLFVLFTAIVRSAFEAPTVIEEDGAHRPLPRTILPNVGDCLQYLQFVFLTGSLSLFYPGFYQPAVSYLNWFSLLTGGFVTHGWTYSGTRDGIYEINGTYGGTFGMEVMSQIVGAPSTTDVWLNMVVTIGIIAILTLIALKIFQFSEQRGESTVRELVPSGFQQTFGQVLCVILSYFSLPIVALSFYQIANAAVLPAYHISLSVLLITAILVAFVWVLRQISVRSIGALLFDSPKRYRRLLSSDGSYRQDSTLVLLLFVLVFIRGASIGGLQISGLVQLAILGACEVVLMASIAGFQTYSTYSIGTISSVARLCSLVAMVAFLDGVASDNTRSVIGYLVLILHICMLVFGFLFPAIYHLGKLCARYQSRAPIPNAYGLRDLQRRQGHRTNVPESRTSSPHEPDTVEESYLGQLEPRNLADTPSTFSLEPSTASSRYYRAPRSPSHSASIHNFDQQRQQTAPSTSPTFSSPYSRTNSLSLVSVENAVIGSSTSLSLEGSEAEDSPSTPKTCSPDSSSRPLGLRWNDYSFREADLFYGAPRRLTDPGTQENTEEPSSSGSHLGSLSLVLWEKLTGRPNRTDSGSLAPQKGFQVIRPKRGS
ncbi:hypothetical protein AAE478_010459 [Parahypoxylon ruwenzoriense]